MRNISLLDCTLRDGGRVIDCAFLDEEIAEISKGLNKAGVDIIEMGFLRDETIVEYTGNSTFFTSLCQIEKYIPEERNALYVVFVDYGMYDVSNLPERKKGMIDGIRFGFTKKDYLERKEDVVKCMSTIKKKGYFLFLQGVNTLNYSDREILELAEIANVIKPYSFGIVDTYGAMYLDDAERIFGLIDNNLDEEIRLDFHSHNNYQLSFALTQTIIKQSRGVRNIIIDATLVGMGKMAGNLNLELIASYLVKKLHYSYDMDCIMDIIDDYIIKYMCEYKWGYSVPAMLAGLYKSHPNNLIYITNKYRVATKDVGIILSMIPPDKRQRYDYDLIEKLYIEYQSEDVDDKESIEKIKGRIGDRNVLMLVPGASIEEYSNKLDSITRGNEYAVFSVNFVHEKSLFAFIGNEKQFARLSKEDYSRCIISSNIRTQKNVLKVKYQSLIMRGYKYFDNSAIMCLKLLEMLEVKNIIIAGFDGFEKQRGNYINDSYQEVRHISAYDEENTELRKMLREYMEKKPNNMKVKMITPGLFTDMVNGYDKKQN